MYRPKDITDRLKISAPTLRLWSNNFSEVLSPGAQKSTTETGTAAQRRYSDEDLALFQRAQQLLGESKTYEQTLEILKSEPPPIVEASQPEPSTPVVITEVHPIIAAFERALEAKDETLKAQQRHIESLEAQIRQMTSSQPVQVTTRPRWGFLRRLLTVEAQDVG